MFSFLNSGILLGLLAVGIPFIVHFLARRRSKPMPFSSILFLKQMQSQSIRRMHIKQWLLLVLRALAVLCLVLAFARPAVKGILGKGSAKSAVAVIIDQSISMTRPDILKALPSVQDELFDQLEATDDVMVIGSLNFEQAGWMQPAMAGKTMRKLTPELKSADLSEAILRGIRAFEEKTVLNRELILFSDFQNHAFSGCDTLSAIQDWEGSVFCVPLTGNIENASVDNMTLQNQIIEISHPLTLDSQVSNYGDRPVTDQLLRLYEGDQAVSQQLISLDAGEKKNLRFEYVPGRSGWIPLHLALDNDAFSTDNHQYLSLWIPDQIRVLLVGNQTRDVRALALALGEKESDQHAIWLRMLNDSQPWDQQLAETDVVIFSNIASIRSTQAYSLNDYVKQGGGVLFFSGDHSDLNAINRLLLEPITDMRLGAIQGAGEGYFTLGKLGEHPLFQHMFVDETPQFKSPEIYRAVSWIGKTATPLLSLNTGDPLMVEIEHGEGRFLFCGTGLDSRWSNLTLSSLFAPLVYRSAVYLGSRDRMESTYLTGDAIHLKTRDVNPKESCSVVLPDGSVQMLVPELMQNEAVLTFKNATLPGMYEFRQKTRPLGQAAVNVAAVESDFHPMHEAQMQDLFPKATIHWLDSNADRRAAITDSRWGREFWQELLILGLLFLILEMIVTRIDFERLRK